MQYFIDFEATQFSDEIISVGCVSETGETFYSEVKAKKKVTPFITSLTGITDSQNKKAPVSDDVFSKFYDWLSNVSLKNAVFYCYGTEDTNFLAANLKRTQRLKAQAALSLIKENLIDYSQVVKEHFGMSRAISLIKVLIYYRKDKVVQSHNALEDAKYLKEIYEYVSNEAPYTECPFYEYSIQRSVTEEIMKSSSMPKSKVEKMEECNNYCVVAYNCDNKGNVIFEKRFETLNEAAKWCMTLIPSGTNANIKNVKKRILIVANNKEKYFTHRWKILNL